MFDTTVTIFNYHEATGLWYPSVVPAVDYNAVRSNNFTSAAGITNGDTAEFIIPCSPDKRIACMSDYCIVDEKLNNIVISDGGRLVYKQRDNGGQKRFVSPKEYQKSDNPEGLITFTPEKDFICISEWDDNEPISDDVAFDSGLYQYLNELYDGVIKISSSAFFSLIPHFEIGGR